MTVESDNFSSQLEVGSIPHGTSVPIDLFERFLPRAGFILELGSGTGEKALRLQSRGYGVTTTDVMTGAIEACKRRGLVATYKDATTYEFAEWGMTSIVYMETQDGVCMEGVLPSLIRGKWKKSLDMADIHLRPGGYLFLSDVQVVGEDENPLMDCSYPIEERQAYVQSWQRRYENNEKIGLPRHTFVVAKPGEKKHLEWGSPNELNQLVESDAFERLAQHVSSEEVIMHLNCLGYSIVAFESKIWQTRVKDKVLPGYVLVAKKGQRYKYHPWKRGSTIGEYEQYRDYYDWAKRGNLCYFQIMAQQLQQYIKYPLEEVYPVLLEIAASEANEQYLRLLEKKSA